MVKTVGGGEILQIADAVSREKNIDRDSVLEAIEQSIQVAGSRKYGHEHDIRAEVNRNNGQMKLFKVVTVAEEYPLDEEGEPMNKLHYLLLDDAKAKDPSLELGSEIREELPPIDFGRIAAQTAKQVIVQKVRDAERARQYEEFKDKEGEIINGVVKRVEYGNVTVDFGRTEATIRRDEMIPRENYRVGDRIRAYIKEVNEERTGPQVVLSRVAPGFVAKLFAQEVPEIYEGIIEVVAVARDPGSRAKMAVISHDPSVNPVLSCVGVRGSRVQAVVSELNGEKIDIIPWTEDGATFLVNALQPAEVAKVVMDEDAGRVEVVVRDDQLSLAIGRRGQNVRLASQLTDWDIDIMTEQEESERRQAEFVQRTQMFQDTMNVDEMVAQLLVSEGFTSLEEVAYVEIDELTVVDGFDEETAEELQARARESLEELNAKALEKARELGVQEDLIEFDGLSPQMVLALAEDGIKDLAEFATCADWELAGGYSVVDGKRVKDDGLLEKFDVGLEEAQYLVMTARVALGIIDPSELIVEELDEDGNVIAVEGGDGAEIAEDAALGDRLNVGFAGSIVTHGRARGIVTETGLETAIGHIAARITERRVSEPPLMIRIRRFTYQVAGAIMIAIAALSILMLWRGGYEATAMVMMGIGLAVSTIPEGLPAALTVALAIGMRRMAANNVIIRKLVAVEALGSCTFICSDKTGTLTVNKLTIDAMHLPGGTVVKASGAGIAPGEIIDEHNEYDENVRERLRELLADRRYSVGAAGALAVLADDAAVETLQEQLALPSLRVQAALGLRRMDAPADLEVRRWQDHLLRGAAG